MTLKISLSSLQQNGDGQIARISLKSLKAVRINAATCTSVVDDGLAGAVYNEGMRRQIRLLHRASLNSHCGSGIVADIGRLLPELIISNIFSNIAASRICVKDAGSAYSILDCAVQADSLVAGQLRQAESHEQEVLLLPG